MERLQCILWMYQNRYSRHIVSTHGVFSKSFIRYESLLKLSFQSIEIVLLDSKQYTKKRKKIIILIEIQVKKGKNLQKNCQVSNARI